MRKRLIDRIEGVETAEEPGTLPGGWIDLESVAEVEISSEEELFPIDEALLPVAEGVVSRGWRAAAPGPQTIRISFDRPTAIRRIYLHFIERAAERSQEFAVYAGSGGGPQQKESEVALREILRQQFSFSPGGATEEIEDYAVDLKDVTVFELRLDPDRAHDPRQSQAYASLASLRLA